MKKRHNDSLRDDPEFKALDEMIKNDPNVDWSRVRFWKATHRRERFLNFLRRLFGLKEKW